MDGRCTDIGCLRPQRQKVCLDSGIHRVGAKMDSAVARWLTSHWILVTSGRCALHATWYGNDSRRSGSRHVIYRRFTYTSTCATTGRLANFVEACILAPTE